MPHSRLFPTPMRHHSASKLRETKPDCFPSSTHSLSLVMMMIAVHSLSPPPFCSFLAAILANCYFAQGGNTRQTIPPMTIQSILRREEKELSSESKTPSSSFSFPSCFFIRQVSSLSLSSLPRQLISGSNHHTSPLPSPLTFSYSSHPIVLPFSLSQPRPSFQTMVLSIPSE